MAFWEVGGVSSVKAKSLRFCSDLAPSISTILPAYHHGEEKIRGLEDMGGCTLVRGWRNTFVELEDGWHALQGEPVAQVFLLGAAHFGEADPVRCILQFLGCLVEDGGRLLAVNTPVWLYIDEASNNFRGGGFLLIVGHVVNKARKGEGTDG